MLIYEFWFYRKKVKRGCFSSFWFFLNDYQIFIELKNEPFGWIRMQSYDGNIVGKIIGVFDGIFGADHE